MRKFSSWLHAEPHGWDLFRLLTLTPIALYAYAFSMFFTLQGLGLSFPEEGEIWELIQKNAPLFFVMLPFLAAFEEVCFRAPLILFLEADRSRLSVWVAVAIFSTIFGLAHGGWINVPIQGVVGVVFSLIFLKCGGLSGRYFKAFLSATTVHSLYNVIAFSTI